MRGSHEEPVFKLRGQLVDTHMNTEAFRRCSPVVAASMNASAAAATHVLLHSPAYFLALRRRRPTRRHSSQSQSQKTLFPCQTARRSNEFRL